MFCVIIHKINYLKGDVGIMVSKGAVVGGLVVGGGIIGGLLLLGASGQIGGYKNTHDLTGKSVMNGEEKNVPYGQGGWISIGGQAVNVWYNEPVKLIRMRAKGKIVCRLTAGSTPSQAIITMGGHFGSSRESIDETAELITKTYTVLKQTVDQETFELNFDTGMITLPAVVREKDAIGSFLGITGSGIITEAYIQDLVWEVIKSKQVGSEVEPTIYSPSIPQEREYTFQNISELGNCLIIFPTSKVLTGEIVVNITTAMKGKISGQTYREGRLKVIGLDDNMIPTCGFIDMPIYGSGESGCTLIEAKIVRGILVSVSAPTELIQIAGKITVNEVSGGV